MKTDIKINKRQYTTGKHWLSTFIIAFISGLLGFLVAGFDGFLILTLGSLILGLLMIYLTFIPFIGMYWYWILGNQLIDWLISVRGLESCSNLYIAKLFPLILYGIFGLVAYLVVSFIALVFIGAILVSIFSR